MYPNGHIYIPPYQRGLSITQNVAADFYVVLRITFLDALASLDFKLSVSQSVIYRFSTASTSTGLSELFSLDFIGLGIFKQ